MNGAANTAFKPSSRTPLFMYSVMVSVHGRSPRSLATMTEAFSCDSDCIVSLSFASSSSAINLNASH